MRQLFGAYVPVGVDGVNFEYVGAVVFLIVVVFLNWLERWFQSYDW